MFCFPSTFPSVGDYPKNIGRLLIVALDRFLNFLRENIETVLIAMILLSYSVLIIISIVLIRAFV